MWTYNLREKPNRRFIAYERYNIPIEATDIKTVDGRKSIYYDLKLVNFKNKKVWQVR